MASRVREPVGEYVGTARRGDVLVFRAVDLPDDPVGILHKFSEDHHLHERGIGVVLFEGRDAEIEIRRPRA